MNENRKQRAWIKDEITKQGDPVYVPFRNGKVILNSYSMPRVFYSQEHYEAHKKKYNGQYLPTDVLVKYVPETVKGE